MKLLAVTVLIFVTCLGYLVVNDLMTGIPFPEAVRILTQTFSVITVQERIILYVAIIIPLLMPIVNYIIKNKKAKTKG